MAHKTLHGKEFTWWHFSELDEQDFDTLKKEFKFHPLDFDDLRDESELSKVDEYKYYTFSIVTLPVFDAKKQVLSKMNLGVFVGEDYIVTVSKRPIQSIERFFARATRSSGLRRELFSRTTGYLLYKILDYAFRDAKVVLRELIREADIVEQEVYDQHTWVTTKRLGILRRNILFLRQVVEPQLILVKHYLSTKKPYFAKNLEIYFDDIGDTLQGIVVMLDGVKNVVDGLFDVNEAFLSHRTNSIIRVLTILSVIFMPPTLITGYYGMNVHGLPFIENPLVISLIVSGSLVSFLVFLYFLDRRL